MNERAPILGELAATRAAVAQESNSDGVVISCDRGPLPAALDAELRRLYANIHSTVDQLKVYGGLEQVTHVYAARRNGVACALFLLQQHGDHVRVLNEGMVIDAAELRRFADHAYARWPQVQVLSFNAVVAEPNMAIGRPLQQFACTGDLRMPLPATTDDYLAGLGRNMRRNIRRYMTRLEQRFPDLRISFLDGDQASEQQIRAVIDLNRKRIASKNLDYNLDDEIDRLVALTRSCGMTGIITAEGRIIAGGVGYRVGDAYFFKVNAHDPQYDDYSTGILSCYLTIRECIARGCREFNFMWNTYPYKLALGGRPRRLDRIVVYRSAGALVRHAGLAIGAALATARHQVDLLLEKSEQAQSLTRREQALVGALELVRRGRRLLRR